MKAHLSKRAQGSENAENSNDILEELVRRSLISSMMGSAGPGFSSGPFSLTAATVAPTTGVTGSVTSAPEIDGDNMDFAAVCNGKLPLFCLLILLGLLFTHGFIPNN